jgi:hypothetical protein
MVVGELREAAAEMTELYEALIHARLVLEAEAARHGEKFRDGMIDNALAKARGDQ